MTQSIKKFGIGSIAFAALMLLVLPLSFAKADGFDGGDFGGFDTTGYTDYSAPSYDNTGGWDTTGYTDYAQPTTDNYGGWDTTGYTDYTTPSYSTGGYMTGGRSTGGYSTGGGYMIGGGYGYNTPVAPSYSNTYAPTTVTTNTSVCSKGNHQCNTTITNPAPVINNNNVIANYSQPTQQYCQSGYSGTYPNC